MRKVIVSKFSNYHSTVPTSVNLRDWLCDVTYKDLVDKIRAMSNKDEIKNLKSQLPCITPSGKFKVRNANGLILHSGFICIDIDGGDNLHLNDFGKVRDELKKIKNISYVALSVSGNGVFCLIPIKFPEKHKEHFEALKIKFSNIGITIDHACGDVSRLRGYSYDENAYFNEEAVVFEQLFEYKSMRKQKRASSIVKRSLNNGSVTHSKVMRIIGKAINSGIDMTEKYEQWFQIGCALSNEFGEEGREMFHLVSENHPKYSFESCDEKFTNFIEENYSYTIGTFFHWAEKYGIS